jgi:hypothetical protein
MATLGLVIGAVCGTLIIGYTFFFFGRVYENDKLAKERAVKTRDRIKEAADWVWREDPARFLEDYKYDPLADDGCVWIPIRKDKCPVENCRIKTEHSHTEALIKRIKE